jgi:uncharacterized repeat protein (TIGR02543 family)
VKFPADGSAWVDIPGATTPTLALTDLHYADNGKQYRVRLANYVGESHSAATTLANIPLAWADNYGSQTKQIGQTATFKIDIPAGQYNYTYIWRKNNTIISGAPNSPSYTTPSLTLDDNAAVFTVTVSAAGGTEIATLSAALAVTPPHTAPGFAAGGNLPATATAIAGAVTLAINPAGYPPPACQWQISTDNGATWNNIAGATATTLTLTGLTTADNGKQYRALLTNYLGATPSAPALLVVPLPPALSVTPVNRAVAIAAGSTTVTITNTGAGTLNYATTITTGASFVSIAGGGAGTLAAGASATVTINYTANPVASNARAATLTFAAAGADNSPQTVTITQSENTTLPPPPPAPFLDANKTVLTLANTTNSATAFSITSNVSWHATAAPIGAGGGSAGWLNVLPDNKTIGTGTITTTGTARAVQANATGAPRTAAINITHTGTGAGLAPLARTIIVTQLAAPGGAGAGSAPASLAVGGTLAFTHGNTTETYVVLGNSGTNSKLQPVGAGGIASGAAISYEYTATGNTATLIFDDTVWQLNFITAPPAYTLYTTHEDTGEPYELPGTFAYSSPATPPATTATVTFNTNAAGDTTATVSPAAKTITAGAAYGPLPSPVRSNYIFTGWFTAATGGQQIAETTTVATPAANHVLYAHWTAAGTGGGGNNNNGGGGSGGGGAATAPALALLAALFAIKAARTMRENTAPKKQGGKKSGPAKRVDL